MRIAVLSLFVAATAFAADTFTQVRFLPPNPDSATAVTARLSGIWPNGAPPGCANAAVSDRRISILGGCIGQSAPAVLTPWSLDLSLGVLQPGIYAVEVRFQAPFENMQARTSLTVQEAAPLFSVTPRVMVFPRIGEMVVIRGKEIECRDTSLCPAPVVRFGGLAAQIVHIDMGEITVRPPAGVGTVDVTVEMGSRTLRRVAAFHYAAGDPPAPEFLTPVFLPVLFSSSGAFGSEWDTEASIRNDNDFALVSPHRSPFDFICVLCSPAPLPGLNPHVTRVVTAKRDALVSPGGRLVYITREAAPNVHFGLLVRDLSRQAEALGTEIPVVREDDLYESAFSLLNVRLDGGFRATLRLYSIDTPMNMPLDDGFRGASAVGSAGRRVWLRIRPMESDELLVNVQVGLGAVTGAGQHHTNAIIGDLAAAFPQLAGRGPLRIEVEPDSPGDLRIWGFAAITNNQTQHVTVISPQ
jgi:hypothetical protein